ncbi:MAG TPA: tripartite tricarboxylate transporter substrate binding protein, partial [Xanthobacteraceae bacterium]|nr:tripartite tricarboxylate transporter substrate binding protein [Xanthobacteraceae bacterium]
MKRFGLALALCLALGPVTASAQDKYPSRPVKVIVPYAPGGATDITSRLFGEQMRQSLGQQFVVENKPGAGGILAIEEMVRSKPDGYTLMVGNVSTNAITPVLFSKKLSINYEKDVASVSRLAIYPSFLITTTHNFEPKTVAELIAYAKKNPSKVRYTSAGVGSFPHFD